MAAKKKRKTKKRRTAAQRAATKRLVAYNKSKGKKRKTKRRKTKRHSVAHHMQAANRRGRQPHTSGVASHYHSGAHGYAAGYAAHRPKRRKGKRRKHKLYTGIARPTKRHKKTGGTVTAASILRGARSRNQAAWLCTGRVRTGCGGGKKGGHVVGVLR